MRHKHSNSKDPLIISMVAAIAAGIGAITALLVSPKNGKELRADIKNRTKTVAGQVHDKVDTTVKPIGDTQKETPATTAKRAAAKTATKVKADADVATTKAKATVKKAQADINDIK